MLHKIAFLLFGTLLPVLSAHAQPSPRATLGGCPMGAQLGYVTVIQPSRLMYWRYQSPATAVQVGDELRLCRYEGNNAVVTLGTPAIAYVLPRITVGALQTDPTLREVTSQDIACVGPEVEAIQAINGDQQDWALLEHARRRQVSLSMIYALRIHYGRALDRNQPIPACIQPVTVPSQTATQVELPAASSTPARVATAPAPPAAPRIRFSLLSAQIEPTKPSGGRWDTGTSRVHLRSYRTR